MPDLSAALRVEDSEAPEYSELNLDHKFRADNLKGLEPFVNLTSLSLSAVGISSFEGIPQAPYLTSLSVSDNKISGALDVLAAACTSLRFLDLSNNRMASVDVLQPLASLPHLARLDVEANPLCKPGYRSEIFDLIPSLRSVDQHDITGAELQDEEDDAEEEEEEYEEEGEEEYEEDDGEGGDEDGEEGEEGPEEEGDAYEEGEGGEEEEEGGGDDEDEYEGEEGDDDEGEEEDEEEADEPGVEALVGPPLEDDGEEYDQEDEPPSEDIDEEEDEEEEAPRRGAKRKAQAEPEEEDDEEEDEEDE